MTVEADDRHLRLLAEFDNFRRRSAREHDAARREGRRAALLPVLDVLDALERAPRLDEAVLRGNRPMDEIQVDVVHPQSAEAFAEGLQRRVESLA